MPARFADLETRVNRAVVGHLSNAMATVGGNTVPVVFDRLYAEQLDGDAAGYAPAILGRDADFGVVAYGDIVTIQSQTFSVVAIEPDGTGLTRLRLRA